MGKGFIVGGDNYGQGSSREHAALAPLQLGVKAVFAKSFARIHRRNLVAQGILALTFKDDADYDRAEVGDTWTLPNVRESFSTAPTTSPSRWTATRSRSRTTSPRRSARCSYLKEHGKEAAVAPISDEAALVARARRGGLSPSPWPARGATPIRGRPLGVDAP